MIFRITFEDNDYQEVLKRLGDKMFGLYSYYRSQRLSKSDDPEIIKEYCDNAKQMDAFLSRIQDEDDFTANDKGRLVRMMLQNIRAYIEDMFVDDAEYLNSEIEFSIEETIDGSDENGEVLYYFPMQDQYIIK